MATRHIGVSTACGQLVGITPPIVTLTKLPLYLQLSYDNVYIDLQHFVFTATLELSTIVNVTDATLVIINNGLNALSTPPTLPVG